MLCDASRGEDDDARERIFRRKNRLGREEIVESARAGITWVR